MSEESTLPSTSSSLSIVGTYLWPLFYRSSQIVVAIVAVAAGLLYVQQESLLYYPSLAGSVPRHNEQNPRGYRHPGERGIANFTSHIITSAADGVQIHAWFCPHPSSSSSLQSSTQQSSRLPTILFFHGNAGNTGLRIPNAVEMLRHLRAHVMLVEYRGYGDSPGGDAVKPTEVGLQRDAVAALDYTRTELAAQHADLVDPNLIYVFGRSLGGAVAFHLAAHAEATGQPLAGCIVENTFTSISDMVDQVLPWLTPIKRFVLRIGWNSLALLQKGQITRTPVLLLAGDADALVPHAHMQKLRDAAHFALMRSGTATTPPVHWHVIRGGQHNESWMQGGRPYWQAWANFLQQTSTATASSLLSTDATVDMDGSTTASSSIPIMNNQFMGMARDAWSNGSSSNKKKE